MSDRCTECKICVVVQGRVGLRLMIDKMDIYFHISFFGIGIRSRVLYYIHRVCTPESYEKAIKAVKNKSAMTLQLI